MISRQRAIVQFLRRSASDYVSDSSRGPAFNSSFYQQKQPDSQVASFKAPEQSFKFNRLGDAAIPQPYNLPFGEEVVDKEFVVSELSNERKPFNEAVARALEEELDPLDVEIRPDGIIYLPEIKYRSILIRAFGPGGWALIPKGSHSINGEFLSREYWLICQGRFVSSARGFGQIRIDLSDATEAARSNALMRCCKDLGVAKDLWNPKYIRQWKESFATQTQSTDGRKMVWQKKPHSD